MIALVFALEYESAAVSEPARLCSTVWNLGGIGSFAASALDHRLKTTKPQLIVSAGFGGALQPGLNVGSLVVGENLSDSHLVRIAAKTPEFTFGQLHTSEDVVEKSQDKYALGKTTGALSVDCESELIRDICQRHRIKFLALRCISDSVDHDFPIPSAILIDHKTGRPNPASVFRYLFSHPGAIPGFKILIQNARTAQKSLARGLNLLLPNLLKSSR